MINYEELYDEATERWMHYLKKHRVLDIQLKAEEEIIRNLEKLVGDD